MRLSSSEIKLILWCTSWIAAAVIGITVSETPDVDRTTKIVLYVIVVILAVGPVISIIVEVWKLIDAVVKYVNTHPPNRVCDPELSDCKQGSSNSDTPSSENKISAVKQAFLNTWGDINEWKVLENVSSLEHLRASTQMPDEVQTPSNQSSAGAGPSPQPESVPHLEIEPRSSEYEEYCETNKGFVVAIKKMTKEEALAPRREPAKIERRYIESAHDIA